MSDQASSTTPKTCTECGGPGPFPKNPGHDRKTETRAICTKCFNARRREQHGRSPANDPDIVRVVELAKRGIKFSDLCNKLDMSPAKCESLLKKAGTFHAPIHVEHNVISLAPAMTSETIQDILIVKAKGKPFLAGAISDTHVGSKYCLRGALRETIQWMYDAGVRDILHSGDILEGCYRHAQYEVSHNGFDEQLDDAVKVFPKLKGLRYHAITGNHDYTFEEKIGMRIGPALQDGFRARGREDWTLYGDRNAYIRLGGLVINLYHPGGSNAYARSYNLQKKIEGYTAIKPQLLFMGHYHQSAYVYERGIHAFQMPCFQGSGSNFAQSLKGPPSIGGLILQWQMSETDRIHDLEFRPRFFFERDDIFSARNEIPSQEVPAVGRERRYRQRLDRE